MKELIEKLDKIIDLLEKKCNFTEKLTTFPPRIGYSDDSRKDELEQKGEQVIVSGNYEGYSSLPSILSFIKDGHPFRGMGKLGDLYKNDKSNLESFMSRVGLSSEFRKFAEEYLEEE